VSKPENISDPQQQFKFRAAGAPLEVQDLIMAYEFFHGRNPESKLVIDEQRSKGFSDLIQDIVTSPEFKNRVVAPLQEGRHVQRGDYRRRPSAEQRAWLSTHVEFAKDVEERLNQAKNWTDYFGNFCAIFGIDVSREAIDLENRPSGAPGAASQAKADRQDPVSERGRILAQLEQIRAMLGEVESSVRNWKG
jgi:hypothetical protein